MRTGDVYENANGQRITVLENKPMPPDHNGQAWGLMTVAFQEYAGAPYTAATMCATDGNWNLVGHVNVRQGA